MEHSEYWIVAGAIFVGLGVVIGAFAAHVIEGSITADRLNTFETGVRYQMYHGLALLMLGLLAREYQNLSFTGWSWIVGTVIFSGSLFLLVLTGRPWLGAITPLGGVAFIIGWLNLIFRVFRQ